MASRRDRAGRCQRGPAHSRRPLRLAPERLESRAVLSVTPSLSGATLAIAITDGDIAALTYSPTIGYSVNGAAIAGTAGAGAVRSILVSDDGSPFTVFTVAGAIPAAAGLESLTATVGGSAGGAINLEGPVVLAGTAPIQLGVSRELASTGVIRLAAGLTAGMQSVSFNGPVELAADVTISTRGAAVTFADMLDGGFTLACDTNKGGATGGLVTFGSAVGSLAPLAGLKILSGGVAQAGQGATISVDAAAKDPGSAGNPAGIVVRAGCGPVNLAHGGTIANFATHGILLAGTPANTTAVVSGFQITGNGETGIRVVGQGTKSAVTISGNTISMPVGAARTTTGILVTGGFPAAGGGNTLAIAANTIDFDSSDPLATSPTYGIAISPDSGVTNATVGGAGDEAAGNTITGAGVGFGTIGILVAGAAPGTTVAGNDLAGCRYGIVLHELGPGNAAAPTLVRGNRLEGTDPDGGRVAAEIGILLRAAGGVVVGGGDAGNTVQGYPYGLVATSAAPGSSVVGNVFTGTGHGATSGVGIALVDAAGLAVGAAGAGNAITATGVGVYAMGDTDGANVVANTIQDAFVGVVAAAARNLAVGAPGGGNTLGQIVPGSNPLAVGVYAAGDCTGTSIRANSITNTADTMRVPSFGIYLDAARGVTVGGDVSTAADPGNTVAGFFTGAYATGGLDGTSLLGNVVTPASQAAAARTVIGLQLAAARGLVVGDTNDRTTTRGNTFARTIGYGGYATGDCTGTMLESNLLTGSPFGFSATSASGLTLSGNHAVGNDVGVTIGGSGAATTLRSNRIYANTTAGIRVVTDGAAAVAAPVLEAVAPLAEASADAPTLEGTLTGLTGRTYRIQHFATPGSIAVAAPQGRTPLILASGLDYEDVTIEGDGSARLAPFFATAAQGGGVASGDVLTATATLLAEGPESEPVSTSAFSAGVTLAPAKEKPLALTFDTAPLGAGLDPRDVWVSIRADGGAGGLSGFLVTYSGPAGTNRLVPFATAGDAISTPLSLADITDPATGRPTLRVTEGIGLSVFVSYGGPLVAGRAAPAPLDPNDPNAAARYQHFELTRHHPAVADDRVNLAHAAYFTAPMSLRSFAGDGTPLEQKWVGITADTAGDVFRQLAAIPATGGTIGDSSAVVRDESGVVRVVGPSSFTAGSPYPSLLPYVKSLAGTTTRIWNFADVGTADGSASWRIELGGGGSAGGATVGTAAAAAAGSLSMTVDDGSGGTIAGTIRVFGTITVTQTLGGEFEERYTADAGSPWLLISPADPGRFDAAIYGQAKAGDFPAVSHPSAEWGRLADDLVNLGATVPDDPRAIVERLLEGDVTAAILLGFAGAAPTDPGWAPFGGTVRPLDAVGGPAITYDGHGGDPQPIAVKNMRSREWWSFAQAGGPPAPKTLQPTAAFYDQYAQIIRAASGNQTATIPYADRLGAGPALAASRYASPASGILAPREYTVGWIDVSLAAPISIPLPANLTSIEAPADEPPAADDATTGDAA
jgi:parallel beta-helix repeat protein